jgi:D-beta-D-heptose 7-phosphate kinase/D-beta-D-heptose 1-phosphate adenosyltransferase
MEQMQRLTRARLEEILDRASGLRLVVVGDVMLDVYLTGAVGRVSPEAPVPVVQVNDERVAVGGAGNVAANVAALGSRCDLIGVVGDDEAGGRLRAALGEGNGGRISAHFVEIRGRPTTTKTRVMARHQHVVRFDRERDDALDESDAEELRSRVAERIAGADALVLEDYDKGVLDGELARVALAAAADAGIPTVVDPKFRGFWNYAGANVFKPNVAELSAAWGAPLQTHDDGWMEQVRARLACRHLLLTLGEQGMALCCKGSGTLRVPSTARDVYDVSGAGDTVTACVAVALATGASPSEAAVLANHAAGIGVGKPGVVVVTPDELRAVIDDRALSPPIASA